MPAPKTVFDALRRLERSADRFLDAEAARKLREEVASHLESAVQARLEMGLSREEAERATLAEFGNVDDVVWQVREAQAARGKALDPVFTAALFLGSASFAGSFLIRADLPGILMLVSIITCLCVCIGVSWRVRRLQWRAFLLAAVPVWMCLTAAQAMAYRTVGEDHAALTTESLRGSIAEFRHSDEVQRKYIANLEAAYHTYRREGGLRIANTYDQETGAIVFGRVRDAEIARRTWEITYRDLPKMRTGLERRELWVRSAEASLERSWLGEFPFQALNGATTAAGVFGVFAAAHLLALFLHYVVDEINRTRHRLRRA